MSVSFNNQSYPSTQCAAVKTAFLLIMAPPHSKLLLVSLKIIACHEISAKSASMGICPCGLKFLIENYNIFKIIIFTLLVNDSRRN